MHLILMNEASNGDKLTNDRATDSPERLTGIVNEAYLAEENSDEKISSVVKDKENNKINEDKLKNENLFPNKNDPEGGNKDNSSSNALTKEKAIDIDTKSLYKIQSSTAVLRQMLIPFLVAGIGSVFAGIVLNSVTKWPVFINTPHLSIMISAFLGLIGNIETTLASRLSTQANLGRLDKWQSICDIVFANFMVIQCQASTVGLFSAFCSLAISTIREETRKVITWNLIVLVCSTSVLTSVISNTLIAIMIIIVILVARRLRINPDNISTPVAASMGDVCTIAILAYVSRFLYRLPDAQYYQISLTVVCLCTAPIFGYFARQSRWTRSVIYTGWTAILGAVIIEQPGGVVMESAFQNYKVMATFQPLVNGVGSNLVGIQTSRMSTFLHASAPKGQLPASNPTYLVSPWFAFFSKDIHARMARLLMLIIIPAHLFYMIILYYLQNTFEFEVHPTIPFLSVYLFAVFLQLALLLYLAYLSVFWAWKKRINPDNSAIPFTSALADVFGNCLMAVAFLFLKSIKDINANDSNDQTIDYWSMLKNTTSPL